MSRPGPQQYTPASSLDIEGQAGQKMKRYCLLAERIRIHLVHIRNVPDEKRDFIEQKMLDVFNADPSRYPSKIPAKEDVRGVDEYWTKCKALTPEEKPDLDSLSLEQCIMQYIVSTTAMQAASTLELGHLEFPRLAQLRNKWANQVMKDIVKYEHEAGLHSAGHSSSQPQDFFAVHEWQDRKIVVKENGLSKEYLVLDIRSSHVDGVSVILQNCRTKEVGAMPQEDFEDLVLSQATEIDSEEELRSNDDMMED